MGSDGGTDLATRNGDNPSPLRHVSRMRDEERTTRKPIDLWDRLKLLLLFLGAWVVMLWAALAQFDPHITFGEAVNQTLLGYWWLLALAGIELIRQVHYVICEHSSRYYLWWTRQFKRGEKRLGRMNDWTRYRIARVLKVLFVLLIIDLALAKIYHLPPATAWIQLPVTIVQALPTILQFVLYSLIFVLQFVLLFWFLSRGGVDVLRPDEIDTRFTDVKGQDSVLEKVKESVIFLENPESIEDKGGKVPRGILLWGPPGTGKTLMAKAVAGETSKPFILVEPSAFMNMFVGVGPLKVKSLFRKARKLALRHGGVIMFLDEADSLGNRGIATGGAFMRPEGHFSHHPTCNGLSYLGPEARFLAFRDHMTPSPVLPRKDGIIAGMGMGGGGMGILPALLSELDGIEKPRGFLNRHVRRLLGMKPRPPFKYRILTVMASNMPEALDPAMLRPGRIDRIYKVGYPSKHGRIDTYTKYLAKVKNEITEEEVDRLATITPYYGGAAIEDLVNSALINAIEEGRDTVEWRDIVKAKQLKDLGPPEDVEYIERERHAVAVHEACHAVAAHRARHHMMIDIATIEKGGTYLGMVANIPPEDQFTHWRSEFEADIMVCLASLVGERMFFEGDSSSGVSGDLETATRLSTYMEGYWGMGSTLAVHGVTKEIGVGGGGQRPPGEQKGPKDLLDTLGSRIELKLGDLLARTEDLLRQNRQAILAVAHALETNKTLTGEDVAAVIEGREGPLIDGRPYATKEFLRSAEAYHDEATGAHRAHSKVGMALPVLPSIASETPPGEPSPNGDGEALAHAGAERGVAAGPPPPRPDGDGDGATADAPTSSDAETRLDPA
jgi:cell division protease FtsH